MRFLEEELATRKIHALVYISEKMSWLTASRIWAPISTTRKIDIGVSLELLN